MRWSISCAETWFAKSPTCSRKKSTSSFTPNEAAAIDHASRQHSLTLLPSRPNTRRLTGGTTHVTSRYWQHCLHAPVRQPGHVDDTGAGLFLRRTCWKEERPRHHDAKLRLDGLDHGVVVGLRIFALLLGRSKERHGF